MAVAYIALDGSGDYCTTPDAAAFSALNDFSVLLLVAPNDWTPAATQVLFCHRYSTGNQRSWTLNLNTTGTIELQLSTDGAATTSSAVSTVAVGGTDGVALWVLAIRERTAGTIKFYKATDTGTGTPPAFASFTQIGTTVSGMTTATLFNSTALLIAGAAESGGAATAGKLYRALLYTGLYASTPTLVRDCNAANWSSGSTWVASTTGETWTLVGNASVVIPPITLALTPTVAATTAVAVGITNVPPPITLALTPTTIVTAAQPIARTPGPATIPVTPTTVVTVAQSLARASGPATIAVTPTTATTAAQPVGVAVGPVTRALTPTTVVLVAAAVGITAAGPGAIALPLTPTTVVLVTRPIACAPGAVTVALGPTTVVLVAVGLVLVAAVVAGGDVFVWTGTQWVAYPVHVWTGSAWVAKPVKVWTGTAWELA